MNLIIKAIGIATICLTSMMFTDLNNSQLEETIVEETFFEPILDKTHDSYIELDQSDLKLDHEVVQYRILFHENDTIKVNAHLGYRVIDTETVAYLLYLSNGIDTLIEPLIMLHEPVGGKLRYKILNVGKDKDLSATKSVENGDVWYLTIGVYNSKKEEITVSFESELNSMELIELDKHSKIEYFSVWNRKDFSGFYFGVKLFILPFGFSIARNIEKSITLNDGAIIWFMSIGHLIGNIKVNTPYGNYNDNRNPFAEYRYAGNQTGTWTFKASGIGFPFKHAIILFYADINPHIQN